ncbi:MAG: sigma-70 family RNA polymerase sigma factor [Myxococcota bacterium]
MSAAMTDTIRAAQRGDAQAFDRVVRQYQDLAFAMAMGRVANEQHAREVTQEALIEMWANLGQLREPKAFTGWLRRIVAKHADRRTRRKRLPQTPLEAASVASAMGRRDPDAAEAAEVRAALRAALVALPAHERMAVSLFYLSGRPLRDIAELLDVPPGTLKKRLHAARQRMRAGMEDLMKDTPRPSADDRLSRQVQLFIAAREGDAHTTRRLLSADAELAGAPVRMDVDTAERYRLLVGNAALKPLHLAANHGHARVAAALLDAGADPDAPGTRGSTPLHLATQTGHVDVVRVLLRAGADPNRPHRHRLTPLHIAAIRGQRDIARALLDAGADPLAPGASGQTPAAWAGARGHFDLARDLHDAAQKRTDAERGFLHTGIKAIDLLAPLPRGGTIYLRGGVYGSGMMALLGELLLTLKQMRPVMAIHSEQFIDGADFESFLREVNLHDEVRLIASPIGADPAQRQQTLSAAFADISDGLAVIDRGLLSSTALPETAATVIVFDYWGPGEDPSPEQIPGVATLDAQITLSRALAIEGVYPAISERGTWSKARAPHHQMADRVREALAAGDRRMRQYLTQPFECYEIWNGLLGRSVAIEDALADCAAILNGDFDDLQPDRLRYRGRAAEGRRFMG